MSIVGDILQELWDMELNYKGVRVNFFGVPRFLRYSRSSVQVSLSRLHKKGYIVSKNKESFFISSKVLDVTAATHKPRRLQLADSDLSHERNVALGALALDNIGGRVKWRILDGLVKDRVGQRCVDKLGLEQRICVGARHSIAA